MGPNAGVATDWHFAHLAARATGGTGLILTEATAVSPEGRISPADLGIWNDTQVSRAPADHRLHQGPGRRRRHPARPRRPQGVDRGPLAGRRARGPGRARLAARRPEPASVRRGSSRPARADRGRDPRRRRAVPRGRSAGRSTRASRSPRCTEPTAISSDSSSPRTATGAPTSTAAASRTASGSPCRSSTPCARCGPRTCRVFFRISATDWLTENDEDDREGWTVGRDGPARRGAAGPRRRPAGRLQRRQRCRAPASPTGPGYQVPFAARVSEETSLPVAAVGLITEPQQAEKIVADGQADAVLLGRELLREPVVGAARGARTGRRGPQARPVPSRRLTRRAPAGNQAGARRVAAGRGAGLPVSRAARGTDSG